MTETDYLASLRDWQQTMDDNLRAEDGWLTLAGLHWLQPGENKVGASPEFPVPLPTSAPATVGTLTLLDGNDVIFEPAPDTAVKIDGEPVTGKVELESDTNHNPTIIRMDDVSFYIVIRGGRTGVRVKYASSPVRLNFSGRVWWPVDEAMRITARINYYKPKKIVEIPDVLGDVSQTSMDAALEFDFNGQTYALDAMGLPSGQFKIIFHDKSCGSGSYPPGRFLISEYPQEDTVVIDFNKAHNPPCAFTSFATCPLPPKQNHLNISIQAGERYIGHL